MYIRQATPEDLQAIAAIHMCSWRNTYHNALSEAYLLDIAPQERFAVWQHRLISPKENQRVLVAEAAGELMGFACIFLGENTQWGSYLDNLHVSKAYQSQGVGKALLTAVARLSYEQQPANGMCLLVNQDNLKAQEFYLHNGARNRQEGVWQAPDGSAVPTYWLVWHDLGPLVTAP